MPFLGELFLSELLKSPVLDPVGEELGRLSDVVIVKGAPLPKIESLIIERKNKSYVIPWSNLNIFNKRIMASSLYADGLCEYEFPEDDLMAVRDLLDKQIVDANGAKVVRANDIKLEGYKEDAMLVAVDVGMRGIMRRLGVGRHGEDLLRLFRVKIVDNLISWNYIQPLHPKLSDIALTVPAQMVSELHPADLADLISQVSPDEGAQFIENLDVETAAEAISELDPGTQTAMISDMEVGRAAEIIEEMQPDSAADIIGSLPADKAKEILEQVETDEAQDIQELLNHEADTAGGLMTNDFIMYPPYLTVAEFLERFKKDAPDIESVYYVFIVDEAERLMGVATLKDILLAPLDAKLTDIMETNIKSVGPDTDEMSTAVTIAKYNLIMLPVVDAEGAIMGVVTLDDIVDRLMPAKLRRKRRRV